MFSVSLNGTGSEQIAGEGAAKITRNWAKLVFIVYEKTCLTGFICQFKREVGQFYLISIPQKSHIYHLTFELKVSLTIPLFRILGDQEAVGERGGWERSISSLALAVCWIQVIKYKYTVIVVVCKYILLKHILTPEYS